MEILQTEQGTAAWKSSTGDSMVVAPTARIAAILLMGLSMASCGGGGSTGSGASTPAGVPIPSSATQSTAGGGTTASLAVGASQLATSATVSQPAPAISFYPGVNTNATTPTTFYIRGWYTTNGIASIQATTEGTTAGNLLIFTVQFKSPTSIPVGTYADTITLEGCYDSACAKQIANSPQTIPVSYVVQADPVSLSSISPSAVAAGASGLMVTLTGSQFSQNSIAVFNQTPLPTTFVSPTQLTATIDPALLATPQEASMSVESSSQQYAQASQALPLLVVAPGPTPTTTSLSPSSAIVGSSDFTLTVNGTNFIYGSTVLWGGAPLPTIFTSPNQLSVSISASQIAQVGTIPVSVEAYSNPTAPVSNVVNFTVAPVPPLTLNSVFPSVIATGGTDFTLTVLGLSFAANASVQWNGTALATTQVSSTVLRATVPAQDIATQGLATITVQNPSSGTVSAGASVSVQNAKPDAVALQITPDHAGAISFQAMSFPPSSSWSVDLGGQPSYALVADGKVFVTVQPLPGSSTGSQLIALDQGSGQTVWGPIQLGAGWTWSYPAYDGGKVFVISSSSGVGPAELQSFDAETGALDWTQPFAPGFETAPTAANGLVTLVSSGPQVFAVDEGSGSIVWRASARSGTGSTPAMTSQGVYVSAACTTDGYQLLTGTSLFTDDSACTGGGGVTAVVANNVFYSLGAGPPTGPVYVDATTGAQLGTFTADVVPAIGATTGYFLQSGTLNAKSLSNYSTLWSFTGDGGLVTSPLIVGQAVIVGSSSGQVYALDPTTGAQLWTTNVGGAISSGNGYFLSGLAAGDGLLVVPAGNTLSAFTLSTNP